MLIEQPRATTPHRVPKWFLVAGAVFFGGIAAGIVVLAIHWPFTQDAITKALEAVSYTHLVVAERLLAEAQKVRVVGRDPKRLERFTQNGAESFIGDAADGLSLIHI